jgi:hypothetical protein
MTEKLFANLRVVFGPRDNYNKDIMTWARTEFGTDWIWAYNHITKTGKTPIRGIDY